MAHAHDHHAHAHGTHAHRPSSRRVLLAAVVLTLTFGLVEGLAGWWAQSLALMSDAAHMLSDAFALGLAALAAHVALAPPTRRHSFGLGRAEVLAALVNGLVMLAIVTAIVVEAVRRLFAPAPVAGGVVMGVALLGLTVNVAVAWMLTRGERTLNVRGALLHVLGDLLGSVAALLAGAVIFFTGWTPADPILSLVVCALILFASLRLLREALHVIMEGVPLHLDLHEVGRAMAAADPRIRSVHDVHIWSLSSGTAAVSAHVVLDDLRAWDAVLAALRQTLHDDFAIDHVTLQPEATVTHVLQPMPRPNR
ncbi:cation transporter [Ectothiorhodospiraceae bacterium 2226]|nr:cation transporter [Ectothiorhodospiraceae bacterium 2226]